MSRPALAAAPDDDRRLLYSVREACHQLSLGRSTVWQLIADGELDTVQIGRRRLIPHEALVDYVERCRRAR